MPFVGTNEGVWSGTGGSDGNRPRRSSADHHRRISGCDVGGVVCPLCWREHVDEETVDAVSVAAGHRDEHGRFKPVWVATSRIVVQGGSDGFGSSSSHFFQSDGGDVGVGFNLISSVDARTRQGTRDTIERTD